VNERFCRNRDRDNLLFIQLSIFKEIRTESESGGRRRTMAVLQGRLEEIMSERHKLEEKISRKKSMVENKRGQQRRWNNSTKPMGTVSQKYSDGTTTSDQDEEGRRGNSGADGGQKAG
jgi:hypothetical protein